MSIGGAPGVGAGGSVRFQWYGDRLSDYIRRGTRRALERMGGDMVAFAYPLAHVDTEAMRNSIRWELPTSTRGSAAYSLEFGIWDHPDNQIRVKPGHPPENPVEYAYFQETQPPPIGKPFLQPAVDRFYPQLDDYIREEMPILDAAGRLTYAGTFTGLGEGDDGGGLGEE